MIRKERSEQRRMRVAQLPHTSRPAASKIAHGVMAFTERRAEVLVAEEYDLRNFVRTPYDPFYSTQAARFFTGGMLHATRMGGFQRIRAVILTCWAVGGFVLGASLTVHAAMVREGQWGATVIWAALFTAMAGALAFALLSRLRGSSPRN